MSELIYLDYNATTPIAAEVAAAMRPYLEGFFGNPSSSHRYGIEARKAVEKARGQLAQLFGCQRDEVVFTSGGSESNNAAIMGTAIALRDHGRHLVTSAIEHPAVTEVCRHLEGEGFRLTYLPVDGDGLVDPAEGLQGVASAFAISATEDQTVNGVASEIQYGWCSLSRNSSNPGTCARPRQRRSGNGWIQRMFRGEIFRPAS